MEGIISSHPKLQGRRSASPWCKLALKFLYQMLHELLRPKILHIIHDCMDRAAKKQHLRAELLLQW